MTDKQPDALRLADALDQNADLDSAEGGNPAVCKLEWDAAALLRTQHAAIERKDALLRQALGALSDFDYDKRVTAVRAITKELQ